MYFAKRLLNFAPYRAVCNGVPKIIRVNLVPRVLSLPASKKDPGRRWSRDSQNLGGKENATHGRGINCKIIAVLGKTQNSTGEL